jgi:hypothetical protein
MPACRLQWKTSAGRCRTWQAVGLAKTLVLVRLNEKRKSLKTLRTQAAKDAAERRSHRDSRGYTTLDDRSTKEGIIGRAGKTTIAKRDREKAKQIQRREKDARREQRKSEKPARPSSAEGEDPDLAGLRWGPQEPLY